MKTRFSLLNFKLCVIMVGLLLLNFSTYGDIDNTYNALSGHTSLATAISDIGANQRILVIDRNETISADITIPPYLSLKFTRPYMLTINPGVTLTIGSYIDAPEAQIFAGTGVVSFAAGSVQKEVMPQWFQDGSFDWTYAIQAAINSGANVYGLEVVFPRQVYNVTGTITLQEGTRLRGIGSRKANQYISQSPLIRHVPSVLGTHLFVLGTPVAGYLYCVQVENMAFSAYNNNSGDCFHLDYPAQCTFSNLLIAPSEAGAFQNGISILGGMENKITGCTIASATQAALRIRGSLESEMTTSTTIEKCNLRQSAWGAIIATPNTIHTVFSDCIIESNISGGIDIYQGNTVVISNCYTENNPASSSAAPIIQVGVNGAASTHTTSLSVIGGHYMGYNGSANANSTFINADKVALVSVNSCIVDRVGKLIKTTSNTMKLNVWGVMCTEVTDIPGGIADYSRFVGELPREVIAAGSQPTTIQTSALIFNSPNTNNTKWRVDTLFNQTNPDLIWSVNGTEKLRFDANGNVGIGTNIPRTRLHSTGSTIIGAAPATCGDGYIGNSQVNIYLNESGNQLKFRVRYSNGTYKTGTVSLL